MPTLLPKISKVIQKNHTGESAAIVDGQFVAFGKDSNEAGQKALDQGYTKDQIMITYIMGTRLYAL
jgi:hypothetical protein